MVEVGDTVRWTGSLGGAEYAAVVEVCKDENGEQYVIVEYEDGESDCWYWDKFEVVTDPDKEIWPGT